MPGKYKICPIARLSPIDSPTICYEEDCGWYAFDKNDNGMCSMRMIAEELNWLVEALSEESE